MESVSEEILKELHKRIKPRVKNEASARDAAKAELERINVVAQQCEEQIKVLEAEIVAVEAKIQQTISDGGDPDALFPEVRVKNDKINALREWLHSNRNTTGAAQKAVQKAQDELDRAVDREIVAVREEYQRRFEDLITALLALRRAWSEAVMGFHGATGIRTAEIASRGLLLDRSRFLI